MQTQTHKLQSDSAFNKCLSIDKQALLEAVIPKDIRPKHHKKVMSSQK